MAATQDLEIFLEDPDADPQGAAADNDALLDEIPASQPVDDEALLAPLAGEAGMSDVFEQDEQFNEMEGEGDAPVGVQDGAAAELEAANAREELANTISRVGSAGAQRPNVAVPKCAARPGPYREIPFGNSGNVGGNGAAAAGRNVPHVGYGRVGAGAGATPFFGDAAGGRGGNQFGAPPPRGFGGANGNFGNGAQNGFGGAANANLGFGGLPGGGQFGRNALQPAAPAAAANAPAREQQLPGARAPGPLVERFGGQELMNAAPRQAQVEFCGPETGAIEVEKKILVDAHATFASLSIAIQFFQVGVAAIADENEPPAAAAGQNDGYDSLRDVLIYRNNRRVLTPEEEARRVRRPWKDGDLAYDQMLENITEQEIDDLARRQV